MKSLKPSQLKLLPALLGMVFTGSAMSAGFQLQNQNGAGTGLAYAGQSANPEDASTVFFNPAGMSYLSSGQNITVAGTVIDRSVKFTNTGTNPMVKVVYPATGVGAFAVGDDGGDAGKTSLVPNFYYTRSLDHKTTFGLGVSATFGSETEYGSNFAGRFSGYFASIKQINVNPSFSYKWNDQLSAGMGLNLAKNEVEFRQYTPYVLGSATGPQVLGYVKGNDTAWGWNAGVMYKLDDSTRIGVAYRSKINFHLTGTQTLTGLATFIVGADLSTPDNLSIAISRRIDDKWEVLGDLTRTGWSAIQSLNVMGGTNPVLAYNFKNTYRYGLGAKYQYSGTWSLRAGVAYDQTPVKSAADRTMTLPDSNRTWLSFGGRMKLDDKSSIDLGYARLFLQNSSTARAVAIPGYTQTVRGDFKTSVNLFSAQYNLNF